ncbi:MULTISPECIES: dicarboxylate/amino acid:cation symporter [Parageobacillus]|jgi:Na+/H+-dicarboxylate symporter|uniref:Sodium:proton antiporter n=1 Tax=Parageobacillus thermoglucosidasius TaxID=1426 RepID=A0A1B7KN29_PARTM|nr:MULTISPECIES: dicarboxylate/amino acid:cation symporter [Parageobacillus]OAT71476.1 sodium:proton antiporter [Parageobacillus thermoglucosidasius]BDG47673.1 sodium:proton antiporter [Parageobacillus sp. KH3-4]
MKEKLKNYRFPIILLAAILIGSIVGFLMGKKAEILKPFGDVFLNMMFMIVVPLVFFSISSTVANMKHLRQFGQIMGTTLIVFIATGFVASVVMLVAVQWFPPAEGVSIELKQPENVEDISLAQQIVQTVTVPDFMELLSKKSMMALIIFAVLVGMAASLAGEKGKPFALFLHSASEVFMKLISIVMWYAPIGLGAYFASLIGVFGSEILGSYLRVVLLYYPVSIAYFFIGFTVYAFIAGGRAGVQRFWQHILSPAATALATGSSVATIPVNLEAAKKVGVPKEIRETVIPIGATIHMDGSCLSAILKIAFLFGIFEQDFSGIGTFFTAIGIAILSGTVMSGVPGGGFIGEMVIVTLYGFPIEALPILSMIGVIVDPPATMVNATGDNVTSMVITRFLKGKRWMEEAEEMSDRSSAISSF